MHRCSTKWFDMQNNPNFSLEDDDVLFGNILNITDIVKLRDFQNRLLLNKIFTNDTLQKRKIVQSGKCEFCSEKQTITHLLYRCVASKKLW